MRFLGCIGLIVVIVIIIAICMFLFGGNSRLSIPSNAVETESVTENTELVELVPVEDTSKESQTRASQGKNSGVSSKEENSVAKLSSKVAQWALIHQTQDYQEYDKYFKTKESCEAALASIISELQSAGLSDTIEQNKEIKALKKRRLAAIDGINKYSKKITLAYSESISKNITTTEIKDSGLTSEDINMVRRKGTSRDFKNFGKKRQQ